MFDRLLEPIKEYISGPYSSYPSFNFRLLKPLFSISRVVAGRNRKRYKDIAESRYLEAKKKHVRS